MPRILQRTVPGYQTNVNRWGLNLFQNKSPTQNTHGTARANEIRQQTQTKSAGVEIKELKPILDELDKSSFTGTIQIKLPLRAGAKSPDGSTFKSGAYMVLNAEVNDSKIDLSQDAARAGITIEIKSDSRWGALDKPIPGMPLTAAVSKAFLTVGENGYAGGAGRARHLGTRLIAKQKDLDKAGFQLLDRDELRTERCKIRLSNFFEALQSQSLKDGENAINPLDMLAIGRSIQLSASGSMTTKSGQQIKKLVAEKLAKVQTPVNRSGPDGDTEVSAQVRCKQLEQKLMTGVWLLSDNENPDAEHIVDLKVGVDRHNKLDVRGSNSKVTIDPPLRISTPGGWGSIGEFHFKEVDGNITIASDELKLPFRVGKRLGEALTNWLIGTYTKDGVIHQDLMRNKLKPGALKFLLETLSINSSINMAVSKENVGTASAAISVTRQDKGIILDAKDIEVASSVVDVNGGKLRFDSQNLTTTVNLDLTLTPKQGEQTVSRANRRHG